MNWNNALGRRKARLERGRFIPPSIEQGPHPFPFRTRKLSPASAMVLQSFLCGRVARRWDPFPDSSPCESGQKQEPRENLTRFCRGSFRSGCSGRHRAGLPGRVWRAQQAWQRLVQRRVQEVEQQFGKLARHRINADLRLTVTGFKPAAAR